MQDLVTEPWLLTLLTGMVLVAGATTWMILTRPAPAPAGVLPDLGGAVARGPEGLTEGASRGEHWLQGWLSDVGTRPQLEVEHVREFLQSPDTVFAALVQVLAAQGHIEGIEGIEGYGTVVVFSPERSRKASGRAMHVRVLSRYGHTVLEVTSDLPPPATLADRQHECVQVHHLLNQLAHRLNGSTRLGRASARAHAL